MIVQHKSSIQEPRNRRPMATLRPTYECESGWQKPANLVARSIAEAMLPFGTQAHDREAVSR